MFSLFFLKTPLNIDREAINEMNEAEANGTFDYIPNLDAATAASESRVDLPNESNTDTTSAPRKSLTESVGDNTGGGESVHARISGSSDERPVQQRKTSPPIKRKNSLDDFELEIEGINLDDNIDVSVSKATQGRR